MKHRKLTTAVLVFLLAAAGFAARSHAADPAVPITPAASSTCSSLSGIFSAPAPLFADTTAASTICGCGDTVCLGKQVNSMCRTARFCLALSVCSTNTGMRCGCDAPP